MKSLQPTAAFEMVEGGHYFGWIMSLFTFSSAVCLHKLKVLFVLQSYQLTLEKCHNVFSGSFWEFKPLVLVCLKTLIKVENTETQGALLSLFTADDQPFFDGKKG